MFDISAGNITDLNELIYAGAKLVCDEIGIPLRNTNRNTKPGCEIRLEELVHKQRQAKRQMKSILGSVEKEKENKKQVG